MALLKNTIIQGKLYAENEINSPKIIAEKITVSDIIDLNKTNSFFANQVLIDNNGTNGSGVPVLKVIRGTDCSVNCAYDTVQICSDDGTTLRLAENDGTQLGLCAGDSYGTFVSTGPMRFFTNATKNNRIWNGSTGKLGLSISNGEVTSPKIITDNITNAEDILTNSLESSFLINSRYGANDKYMTKIIDITGEATGGEMNIQHLGNVFSILTVQAPTQNPSEATLSTKCVKNNDVLFTDYSTMTYNNNYESGIWINYRGSDMKKTPNFCIGSNVGTSGAHRKNRLVVDSIKIPLDAGNDYIKYTLSDKGLVMTYFDGHPTLQASATLSLQTLTNIENADETYSAPNSFCKRDGFGQIRTIVNTNSVTGETKDGNIVPNITYLDNTFVPIQPLSANSNYDASIRQIYAHQSISEAESKAHAMPYCYNVNVNPVPSSIPQYTQYARLKTNCETGTSGQSIPLSADDCVNIGYLNDNYIPIKSSSYDQFAPQLYGHKFTPTGGKINESLCCYTVSNQATWSSGAIAQYGPNGRLRTNCNTGVDNSLPLEYTDCINFGYLNDNYVNYLTTEKKSIKIGTWTINEDNGDLVFTR